MDRISQEDRSKLMGKVRGSDTGIEVLLRLIIWNQGYRYRKNHRVAGVKVDLAFPRYRLVVFIDGCFWHGCPVHYSVPGTRPKFWADKIRCNVYRDRKQTLELERRGWGVLRIWGHSIKKDPEWVAGKICSLLRTGKKPARVRDWRVVEVKRLAGNDVSLWQLEDLRDGSLSRKERRGRKNPKTARTGR